MNNWWYLYLRLIAVGCLVVLGWFGFAEAQISNATYEIEASVLGGGGASTSNTTYSLDAVLGESFIGSISNSSYEIFAGFLQSDGGGTECSDGIDNDGDGFIDLADDGCSSASDDNEYLVSGGGGGGGGGSGGGGTGGEEGGEEGEELPEEVAPSCILVVDPEAITAGESIQLSWSGSALAASGHTISNIGAVAGSGYQSIQPSQTETYQGAFIGSDGSTVACSATVQVVEESAGEIVFEPDAYVFDEEVSGHLVSLERQGGASGTASVLVQVSSSVIAQNGSDYQFAPQTVVWSDGESGRKFVPFTIFDDEDLEGPETVELRLSAINGASYGASRNAVIRIEDDEVEIEDPTLTIVTEVNNRGIGSARIEDFPLQINTTTVASGQTITVPADAGLRITASILGGYTVASVTGGASCPARLGQVFMLEADTSTVCRIVFEYTEDETDPEEEPIEPENPVDQDPEGDPGGLTQSTITFAKGVYRVDESSEELELALERTGSTARPATVEIMSVAGEAQLGADYELLSSRLTWGIGEGGVKYVRVRIMADAIPEAMESFTVSLVNVTEGGFGPRSSVRVEIYDPAAEDPIASPLDEIEALEPVRRILASKEAEKTIQVAATAGVTSGIAAMMVVGATNPSIVLDLVTLPFRLWSLLLSVLGLRKRNQPWGVVYDSISKQPLDPAHVVIRNEFGEEVGTSITDLDGRYGFLVQAGTYTIEAGKTNYIFPSRLMKGKARDELYDRLYFGEPITMKTDGEVILRNIPMDPKQVDWNQKTKLSQDITRFYNKHSVAIAVITDVLFYFGVVTTSIATIIAPERYNILILIAYGVLMILRIIGIKVKSHGRVYVARSGDPVAGATLRFSSEKTGVEVAKRMTDAMGRYYALLNKGTYKVDVEVAGKGGEKHIAATLHSVKTKKGIIRKFFKI